MLQDGSPEFILTSRILLTVTDFRLQLAFFKLPKSRRIWWAVNIFISKQMFGPLAGGQDVVPGRGPGIHRATRGSSIHSWSRPERDCPEIQTPGGRPWPCQLGRVFTWPHAFPFLLRETDRPLVSVCACTTPPLFGFRNLPLYSAVQKSEGYVQNGPVSSSISRGCFGASVENLD